MALNIVEDLCAFSVSSLMQTVLTDKKKNADVILQCRRALSPLSHLEVLQSKVLILGVSK